MIADRLGDETGGDRRAVVMQDRHQPHWIYATFGDNERTKLAVSVLLDNEHEIMVGDETANARVEREGANPHTVERMAACFDHANRLVHRRRSRAVIDDAVFGRLTGIGEERPRYQVLGSFELADQPLHLVNVGGAFLGGARVAVARTAAGEE